MFPCTQNVLCINSLSLSGSCAYCTDIILYSHRLVHCCPQSLEQETAAPEPLPYATQEVNYSFTDLNGD